MTQKNSAPDIEIYVHDLKLSDATPWLENIFDSIQAERKKKGMPKHASPFLATWQDQMFQVIVFENVIPGYTSVWFDNPKLPWSNDNECAFAAATHFNEPVRITAGGWDEQADPDEWIEVLPNGQQKNLTWRT